MYLIVSWRKTWNLICQKTWKLNSKAVVNFSSETAWTTLGNWKPPSSQTFFVFGLLPPSSYPVQPTTQQLLQTFLPNQPSGPLQGQEWTAGGTHWLLPLALKILLWSFPFSLVLVSIQILMKTLIPTGMATNNNLASLKIHWFWQYDNSNLQWEDYRIAGSQSECKVQNIKCPAVTSKGDKTWETYCNIYFPFLSRGIEWR